MFHLCGKILSCSFHCSILFCKNTDKCYFIGFLNLKLSELLSTNNGLFTLILQQNTATGRALSGRLLYPRPDSADDANLR